MNRNGSRSLVDKTVDEKVDEAVDKKADKKVGKRASNKAETIVETVKLTKSYPGLTALDQVDFQLKAGETHILFGENGAGKSTLISMLAGAKRPSSGKILFKGQEVKLRRVHEARSLGISAVFQEFSLIPQMTVEENLFLGAEITKLSFLRKRELVKRARQVIDQLEFDLEPSRRVSQLARAEQQMVEIAKAFRSDLSVLILDEPTASLTNHETQHLFKLIRNLKRQGVGIIYITHRIAEVFEIGDRITVLRDGRRIDTQDVKDTTEEQLLELMTGRVIGQIFPKISFKPKETVLEIKNLTTADGAVRGASIKVRKGEIVGLAGLIGSGKSRIARACFGALKVSQGEVNFKGENCTGYSTRKMLDRGFLLLPSDRRSDGLMMMRSARENMSLVAMPTKPWSKGLVLDRRAEKKMVEQLAQRLNLTPRRIELAIDHFSGGNQQKAMLARCLTRDLDMVVFDEPTVGVDVGTRVAIYQFIAKLCENGAGVLLISSDLPEVLHLSGRAYVLYQGQVQAELAGKQITEENVLANFFENKVA